MNTVLAWLETASSTRFGGNSVQDYLVVLLVFVLGVLLSRASRFLLSRFLPRLAQMTETDLDDRLAAGAVGPLAAMVLLPFLQAGVAVLSMPPDLRALLGNGLTIAFDVILAVLLLRAVDVVFRFGVPRWLSSGRDSVASQAVEFGRKFSKIGVILVIGIGVLKTAGFDILSLVTGLGIGGLAVALAAQETLGNVLGSLQIMTDRPYDVGDFIAYESHTGRVTEVGLRSSKVLTSAGVRVIVPNKKLAEAPIQNLSVHKGLTIETHLGLTYDTCAEELRRAMAALREEVAAVAGTHEDVRAHFIAYGPYSLDVRLVYFITDGDRWVDVKSEVNLAIRERFEREGLRFAYPTQTLHVVQEPPRA